MTKKVLTIPFFVLLVFCSTHIFSQEGDYINGILVDARLNEPIAFATIRIKDRAIGVISNEDGSFRIPVKFKEYGDILKISSMGYQSTELLIYDLSLYLTNTIRLEPAVEELKEVVVKGKVKKRKKIFSARQIVEEAIANISRNYPMDPFSTVGYYRDYQFENGQYLNLNEAILEVFDRGYGSIDLESTKALIYDLNQNDDFYRDTLALEAYDYIGRKKVIEEAFLPNYGGNEFAILRIHDAIRNYKVNSYSFIHRFDFDLLRNHRFTLEPDTYFDGENLYTISFVKDLGDSKTFPKHSAYGTMYVSKRNFAIHWLEYSVYNTKRRLPKGELNKHGENSELVFEVKSEYRRVEDKMYLNYISFYNIFEIQQPPKFKITDIAINFDRKCFEIKFNNIAEMSSALRHKNYDIRFEGKKIKIDRIQHTNQQVKLFPKLNPEESQLIFSELRYALKNNRDIDSELFSIETKSITDVHGNKIHDANYKDFNQFREFFVQEVKTNSVAPPDSEFMHKNAPIFKDQPIVRPDNFDDYWMNTPLQKIEQ